jgi:DNA invertase Pin-like site-specific DNA recombinase
VQEKFPRILRPNLTEAINTATQAGRMMMQIVGSFAEFERAMLREHTKIGLETARGRGVFADVLRS